MTAEEFERLMGGVADFDLSVSVVMSDVVSKPEFRELQVRAESALPMMVQWLRKPAGELTRRDSVERSAILSVLIGVYGFPPAKNVMVSGGLSMDFVEWYFTGGMKRIGSGHEVFGSHCSPSDVANHV